MWHVSDPANIKIVRSSGGSVATEGVLYEGYMLACADQNVPSAPYKHGSSFQDYKIVFTVR